MSEHQRAAWRRFRNARGPVLVAIWAFAPPLLVQSPDGGLSLSLGASSGQYESVSRGCSGELISSTPHPLTTTSVVAEYELTTVPFRIAAFGGPAWVRGAEPIRDDNYHVGGLVAWEARRFGLGLGLAATADVSTLPAFYLRIGDRLTGYLQADIMPVTALPTATGLLRAGIGFQTTRVSGLAGLSLGRSWGWDSGDADNGGPFVDLNLGLTERLDLLFAGSFWEFEKHLDWGAGIGLRYRPAW